MHAKNQLQVENNVSTQWPGLIIKGVSIMSKRVLSKMATRISQRVEMFVLHDGVDISSGSSSAICIRTRFCPRSLNCICWNPSQITGRVKLTRKIPPINSKGTNIIDLEVKLMRSATCKQQQKLNFSVRKWQCTKQPFIKVVRMTHNITACLPCIKVAASILVRGALIVSYCVVMNTFEPR